MATQPFSEPLPLAVGAPPGDAGGALPGGQAGVLYEFLRKLLKLAGFRLTLLCDNFDFSPLDRGEVVAKVRAGGLCAVCRRRTGWGWSTRQLSVN